MGREREGRWGGGRGQGREGRGGEGRGEKHIICLIANIV